VRRVELLATAALVDVCVVMRHEGKGTGQIDRVPAAADIPVAIEKKIRLRCQVKFSSRRCEWGRRRVGNRILPLSQHYSAGGRVTRAAGPHTHLALPTSSAPCLPLKWLASVADSNATTTRNVQDFTAADILASRLVLTTGDCDAYPGANFITTRECVAQRVLGRPVTR